MELSTRVWALPMQSRVQPQFSLESLRGYHRPEDRDFVHVVFDIIHAVFDIIHAVFDIWGLGDFLRDSLALIQAQYKHAPMSAKGAVWPTKDSAIFTFSSMSRSKTSKAYKLKTPFPINNLIIMFQSPKTIGGCQRWM